MEPYNRFAIKMGLVEPEKKKPYRMPKESKKRAKLNREYRKHVGKVLQEDNLCKIGAPGCTKIAQGLHHIVKRTAKNLMDNKITIPACNSCNLWVEENSKKAKEKGLTQSKFLVATYEQDLKATIIERA